MKELAGEFDELNELIYVADTETYELLYLNRRGLQVFGLKDPEQIKGRKCYEVLQGRQEPCDFCNNHLLSADTYLEWEIDNELADGHFLLKDRLVDWNGDGRLSRMEIALDVTRSDREKKRLQETLDRERVVLECIKMMHSSPDSDVAIQNTLQVMGEFLHSERTYIFEIYGRLMDNTYEWCAPGISAEINRLKDIPVTDIRRWMSSFQRGECIIIKDLEELKESDPLEYRRLKPQNIRTLVTVPLIENDAVIGFFGVDNPPVGNLENISAVLDILAYFFQSLLLRKRMAERLSQLSFMDGLTGTMNRNAFIRDITPPLKDKGYGRGIVFIDVNGLKETNDKYGHVAGDELLMRTCEKMESVFSDADKYRTGGDEFVIICRGMEKQEFQERAELLREKFRKAGSLAAMGVSWAEEGKTLQEAVDEAENLMYHEKKSFYTSIHQQEIPGRNVKMTEPEGEAEPGGVTDILEEAQVKQLAGEMLRLYFEKQDVKGMLRHMDASCIWTDEEHQRVYGRREAELYFTRLADQYRGCRIEDLQQYSRKLAADTWLCCIWCYVDKPGENGKRIRMPFKDSKIMKKEQNGNFKCYFVHISRMVSAEDAMEEGG